MGVIQHLEFSIYNRWGERVFLSSHSGECWDGTYKGKMQDVGVYIYWIRATTFCGSTFKKRSFVLGR
jgi:gliding motility-associated-like protein